MRELLAELTTALGRRLPCVYCAVAVVDPEPKTDLPDRPVSDPSVQDALNRAWRQFFRDAKPVCRFFDRGGRLAVRFDSNHRFCTARYCLKTDSPGSGKEIEKSRPFECGRQNRKQRFLYPPRRGADVLAFR